MPIAEPEQEFRPGRLLWTRHTSLTARILAVNIIALGLLAGSLFYLDNYRRELLAERFVLAKGQAEIAAQAPAVTPEVEGPGTGRWVRVLAIGILVALLIYLYARAGG